MGSSQHHPPRAARFTFKDGFHFGLGFFAAGLIFTIVVSLFAAFISGALVPKFVDTREAAYESAIKSDLRNLAAAEEVYFADHLTYTDQLDDLDFNPSSGVTVTILNATVQGWRASATHVGTGTTCEIYYGSVSEPSLASTARIVECE